MPFRLCPKALPTDGASHFLLSGDGSRPSTMQVPANASSAQGQCGQADSVSANTNRMTPASKGPFSSSQVSPEADTGQAFAPACPSPLQVSIDKILAFVNPQLDRHSGKAAGPLPRQPGRDEPVVHRGNDTR